MAAFLSTYLEYLSGLLTAVREALRSGHSLEETLARLPLDEKFLPGAESPLAAARPLMAGFHRWNVKKAYIELDEQPNVALQ